MSIILLVLIIIILAVIASKTLRILRPYEKGVVERLGKYNRTVESGLNIIIPFIESSMKLSMHSMLFTML